MKFDFLNKKRFFLLVLVLIFLLIAGFFWWRYYKKEKLPEGRVISSRWSVNTGEYEVINISDKKIIEHKKEGLTFDVPNNWIIKKYEEEINLLSPEIELDEYGGISLESFKKEKACVIAIEISKCEKLSADIETEAEILENLITEVKDKPIKNNQEIIEVIRVDNKLALRSIFLQYGEKRGISVEIPINNTIYTFTSGIIFSEECINKFDKFLETVLINPSSF